MKTNLASRTCLFGKTKRMVSSFATIAFVATLILGPAKAATRTWNSTSEENWSTQSNWSGNVLPLPADTAALNSGTATIVSGSVRVSVLQVGIAADSAAGLIMTGGTFTTSNLEIGNPVNSTGMMRISGNGTLLEDTGLLYIGYFGKGTMTITDGGKVINRSSFIGAEDGSEGHVTVDGSSSLWENNGYLYIGYKGYGTLTISGGGKVTNTSGGSIGHDSTGVGRVTVSDNASWQSGSPFYVGHSGDGSLDIRDSGTVTTSSGVIGFAPDSKGNVTVGGSASLWENTGALDIGDSGTGTLTISGDGKVTNRSLMSSIGKNLTGVGKVTVSDNALWQNSANAFHIGSEGDGSLTITGNGKVINTYSSYIGYGPTGVGRVTVSDNALWQSGTVLFYIGYSGNGSLTITGSGKVTSPETFVGSSVYSTGSVTIRDSGLWQNAGGLYVGHSGTGEMTISDSGTVTSVNGYIGYDTTGIGSVTVSGSGSLWANTSTLAIGEFGKGTLEITDGGSVTSKFGYIGNQAGSSGSVTVSGSGSLWQNTASTFMVGNSGTGTLLITGGGKVTNTVGSIGTEATGNGTVTVSGSGSLWQNTGNFYVGRAGKGVLAITNGGKVTTNSTSYIGSTATGSGTVTVSGSSSLWQNTGVLYIGDSGTGVLEIIDGGTVTNTRGFIGNQKNSNGAVTVSGSGSIWENTGPAASIGLHVGNSGTGMLAIAGGGKVTSNYAIIGNETTGIGTVTVSGSGSLWQNADNLMVGDSGTGAMEIIGGGKATNITGYIGSQKNSSGAVTVSGAGSLWTTTGFLFIGESGKGTLNISDGGKVVSGGLDSGGIYYNDTQIAVQPGSEGNVTVSGTGSLWENINNLYLGYQGKGTLEITDGGRVTTNDSALGVRSYSSVTGEGRALVSGPGSLWANRAYLYVGFYGTGTLDISNGGTVTNRLGIISYMPGSVGGVTISGTGSLWHNNDDLYVGYSGPGTLDISNGGTVVTDVDSVMGIDTDGKGSVTVSGSSSLWKNIRDLYAGYYGTGALEITDGGTVTSVDGVVGTFAGSKGTITISGTYSLWQNTGDLYMGYSGTGTLTLAGGSVQAASIILANKAGSQGTLDITGDGSGRLTNTDGTTPVTITGGAGAALITFTHTAPTPVTFANALEGDMTVSHQSAGTTILSGANTFTGTLALDAGTVQISSANNLGQAAVTGSATLALDNAGDSFQFAAAHLTGDFNGTTRVQNGTTLALTGNVLTLLNRGVLELAAGGAAAVLADTTLNHLSFTGGTLQLASVEYFPAAALNVTGTLTTSSGAVQLAGLAPTATLPPAPPFVDRGHFADQSATLNPDALLLVTAAALAGDITQLAVTDSAGAALNGDYAINYDDTVTATYGLVALAATGDSGQAGLYLNHSLKQLDIHTGKTLELRTDDLAEGSTRTLAAQVTGAGNLTITGTPDGENHLILSHAANTYTGLTTVTTGNELRGGNTDIIAASAALILETDATFNTGAYDQSIQSLNGAGAVLIAAGRNLTLAGITDGLFTGAITGDGNLVKNGAAAQQVGDIAIAGLTTVNAGHLDAVSIAADVENHAALTVAQGIGGSVLNTGALAATAIGGATENTATGTLTATTLGNRLTNHGTATVNTIAAAGADNTGHLRVVAITGNITNTGIITLDGANTAHRFAGHLRNDGLVDFRSIDKTLTIDSLSGEGFYVMGVNLTTREANRLFITGQATGTHTLHITNLGDAPGESRNFALPLVTHGAGSDAFFTGALEYNMDSYQIIQGDGGQLLTDPDTWYFAFAGQSQTGDTILATAGILAADWHYSLDSLHKRMGQARSELQTLNAAPAGGIWLRANAYHLNADPELVGAAFRQDTWSLTLGLDKAFVLQDATLLGGGFLTMNRSERRHDIGASESSTNGLGAGLYATWLHNNGWYADLVAKADRYKNRLDARATNAEHTRARYNNQAQGLSLELGRLLRHRAYWIEPSLQAAIAWLNGADYDTDANMRVRIDSATAAQYRGQMRFGMDIGARWSPYAKIAAVRSDTDGGALHADGRTYTPRIGGWRHEAGAGVSCRIDARSQLYLDYEYNKARLYERPWSLNLGYRREF